MPSHDLDPVALVAGVIFGGTALVYLIDVGTGLTGRWVWPVLLIVIGVVGLLASRRHDRSTTEPESTALT